MFTRQCCLPTKPFSVLAKILANGRLSIELSGELGNELSIELRSELGNKLSIELRSKASSEKQTYP